MIEYSQYKEDCVRFLQKLVQTPSVNGREGEKAVVDLIVEEAERLNLPHKIYTKNASRPNIFVGEGFSNNDNLLLVAHMDTVPEGNPDRWEVQPFAGAIQENRLYGRGAVDCKGGIALSLYTLKILQDSGKSGAAKFVAVVDEESGADSELGLRYLLEQGLRAREKEGRVNLLCPMRLGC